MGKISLSLLKFPFKFGLDALKRLNEVQQFFDKQSAYARDDSNAAYSIHMMVVHPDVRGKGHGTQILHDCLLHHCGSDELAALEKHNITLVTQTTQTFCVQHK